MFLSTLCFEKSHFKIKNNLNNLNNNQKLKSKSKGFSLVEYLIALLILSFGILSMGSLQMTSQQSNQSAHYSLSATILAQEYIEMMRSNPILTQQSSNPYLIDSDQFSIESSFNCLTSLCDFNQLALFSITDWVKRIKSHTILPDARAIICIDSNPKNGNGNYKWDCDHSGSSIVVKIGWINKNRDLNLLSEAEDSPKMILIASQGDF